MLIVNFLKKKKLEIVKVYQKLFKENEIENIRTDITHIYAKYLITCSNFVKEWSKSWRRDSEKN
jgi:hypothetical protein